jgi:hypothetical protein
LFNNLLKGPDKLKWEAGCSKEIARLAQGRKDASVKGTESIHFINFRQLPKGKKTTYLRICANYRPQKSLIPTASAGQLAATLLITKVKHTLPLLILPPQNFS